ncbi:MAG: hypothetical protein Q4D11_06150, partial [Rhodospirillales bacterium]|nr:hypothetical protein [Rhodospirillales bacterium]
THKREFVDWNMMELFMTAPTPPAKRIDGYNVIFKDVDVHEAMRIKIYPDLSSGAIDFAKRYVSIFGTNSINFSCDKLIEWVNILCTMATGVDKKHFISIYHAWDQEHTLWSPVPLPWFVGEKRK